jgi:hypothetical protein
MEGQTADLGLSNIDAPTGIFQEMGQRGRKEPLTLLSPHNKLHCDAILLMGSRRSAVPRCINYQGAGRKWGVDEGTLTPSALRYSGGAFGWVKSASLIKAFYPWTEDFGEWSNLDIHTGHPSHDVLCAAFWSKYR